MQVEHRLWAFVGVVAVAVSATRKLPPPDERVSFSTHGSDWAQGGCSSRGEQSPVNLNEIYRPIDNTFSFFYANVHSQAVTLRNDGRTISIDVTGQGFGGLSMPFASAPWYNLKRIDIHAASEHTLRGKHFPIEVQLVHQASSIADPTIGHQLVAISVFIDCLTPPDAETVWPAFLQRQGKKFRGAPAPAPAAAGTPAHKIYTAPAASEENFNPTVQVLVEQRPPIFDEEVNVSLTPDNPWQLGHLVSGGTYFMYRGSETLPPCEERVLWLVRREPVMASNSQVRALHDRLYYMTRGAGNYRTIMPLNQRLVRVWAASLQEPPAIPLKPPFARSVPDSSHDDQRESPAIDYAKDAITIAKATSDYAKDLELRLGAGSAAYLKSVQPPVPPPIPQLDRNWAEKRITKEIERQVQDAISENADQLLPAAGNLARSYTRQEILRAGGLVVPPEGLALAPAPARFSPELPVDLASAPAASPVAYDSLAPV